MSSFDTLKYALGVILLLNARSLPFAWHLYVFKPALLLRLRFTLFRLRHLLSSRKQYSIGYSRWLDGITEGPRNAASVFDHQVIFRSRVLLDDGDYNMHMSNSCYPKRLDPARFQHALKAYPAYLGAGGAIALASTQFNFIKEIPILSKYEIHTRVVAWDTKWVSFQSIPGHLGRKTDDDHKLYVLGRFVTRTKPKPPRVTVNGTSIPSARHISNLHSFVDLEEDARQGVVTHCISLNVLCFKAGPGQRVTIPPALVFGLSGYKGFGTEEARQQARALSHNRPKLTKYLKGGSWKDAPSEERWWEVISPELESRRVDNLRKLEI